jgi:hypothetical protein
MPDSGRDGGDAPHRRWSDRGQAGRRWSDRPDAARPRRRAADQQEGPAAGAVRLRPSSTGAFWTWSKAYHTETGIQPLRRLFDKTKANEDLRSRLLAALLEVAKTEYLLRYRVPGYDLFEVAAGPCQVVFAVDPFREHELLPLAALERWRDGPRDDVYAKAQERLGQWRNQQP